MLSMLSLALLLRALAARQQPFISLPSSPVAASRVLSVSLSLSSRSVTDEQGSAHLLSLAGAIDRNATGGSLLIER